MQFKKKALPPARVNRGSGCCGVTQWPDKVVDKAFQYFMQIDEKLERKYSGDQIAQALREDFPEEMKRGHLQSGTVTYWARCYDWKAYFQQAVDKATAATDDLIMQLRCFDEEVAVMVPKLAKMRRFAKFVNNRELQVTSVNRLAPTIGAYMVDLVMINQMHYRRLMSTRDGGSLVYDCDKIGSRKQLFEMWMTGVNKVMEVFGVVVKRKAGGQIAGNAETETTQGGGVPMTSEQYDNALRLIGLEQLKGGFGSELTGPDDSKFPSKQGDPNFIPPGSGSADSEG